MPLRRRGKRYLLLTSSEPIGDAEVKELTKRVAEMYPDITKRKLVWLEKALIVKTDVKRVDEQKQSLALSSGSVHLKSSRVSGSISKLKRLAAEEQGRG